MTNPKYSAFLFCGITASYGMTVRQTDMARSTRLVILIRNIYTLGGTGIHKYTHKIIFLNTTLNMKSP